MVKILQGNNMYSQTLKINKKLVITLSIIFTVVSASVLSTVLILNTKEKESLKVEFFPKSMKSCPYHQAWLIASVTSSDSFREDFTLEIETNTSIDFNYFLWNTTTNQYLIEILVSPKIEHIGENIEISLSICSGDLTASDTSLITIVNWTLTDSSYAETLLEPFISYLSQEKLDFQINETTTWEGICSGIEILIVQHYLFKSEFWEIEVSWHVMIAPHDWVKIYLRRRSDFSPIWSGTIESWSSGNHTILETVPPETIYR